MQKKLIVLIIGSLLATSSFAAPKSRAERQEARAARQESRAAKEESIGVGSGAAIGALAGGPVGNTSPH